MTKTVIESVARLRAGFVGAGFMAEVHSRAARANGAEPYAGAASNQINAERAARRLGFGLAYSSADELLADDDIDVVHICTPNSTHAEFALKAIDAGKHVICEKPLATKGSDAELLVDRAASAGVTATVPFVYRYHPMVLEARARVSAGHAGTVLSIQGNYLQDWLLSSADDNWRVDEALGGPSRAFADIGSHLCDLVEFVTGDRIGRLNALTRTVFSNRSIHSGISTEDIVALLVETTSGAIGTLLVSQVAPGRKNSLTIEVTGSEASIRFDQEQPECLWIGRRAGSELLLRDTDHLSPSAARVSVLPAGHPLGYQDAFNAFIADSYAAIRGSSPDGLPTFVDGLRQVRVTEAVLASAATGDWVNVATGAEDDATSLVEAGLR